MHVLDRIKKVPESGKSAIVYTLATVFSRGLAIITLPIFTRIMNTSQIGIVSLYNSWYSMISMIATLSLTSGGYVVALKEFSDQREEYQSSVLTLTSIVATGIALLYFIAPSFWCEVTGLPNSLLVLMLVGFFFAPAHDFWLARQRYEYKYKLSAVVTVLSAVIASVASVVVVLYLNDNNTGIVAEGRLFANYSVIYGVAIIIWIFLMVKGKTFYNEKYWKFSLRLSIPLIGYSIASQVLNVSDRMMISQLVGNNAVGIYSTLYTVSSLSLMVWQAIHASFVPYLFQNMETKENGIKKTSFQLMLLYSFVAVLMTYFAPEIVRVLATDEYYEAIYIMPPIAAGVFFTSYANIYSDIAVYYKNTSYVMYPAAIAALANILLNYVFIRIFGYTAAAYTTLASFILLTILQAKWANRLCKDRLLSDNSAYTSIYDDRKLALLAVITIVVTLSGVLVYDHLIVRYAIIVTALIAIGILGLRRKKQ